MPAPALSFFPQFAFSAPFKTLIYASCDRSEFAGSLFPLPQTTAPYLIALTVFGTPDFWPGRILQRAGVIKKADRDICVSIKATNCQDGACDRLGSNG